MTPEDYDTKARSLRLGFEHAIAACARDVQTATRLHYGEKRANLIVRAGEGLGRARQSLGERAALANAAGCTAAEQPELTRCEKGLDKLEAELQELCRA